MNGHAVAGKTPAIKQLLLCIHVVKNFNLEISRCHLAEKADLTRQRELHLYGVRSTINQIWLK